MTQILADCGQARSFLRWSFPRSNGDHKADNQSNIDEIKVHRELYGSHSRVSITPISPDDLSDCCFRSRRKALIFWITACDYNELYEVRLGKRNLFFAEKNTHWRLTVVLKL